MRLKIHRNEALESTAQETVEIGMEINLSKDVWSNAQKCSLKNIITTLGFLCHLQGHSIMFWFFIQAIFHLKYQVSDKKQHFYRLNLSFKLYARFRGTAYEVTAQEIWKNNRNAKKFSNDNCKTYSPPGLHLLCQPPYTLAPIPLCWLKLPRGIFPLRRPGRQSRWPCLK